MGRVKMKKMKESVLAEALNTVSMVSQPTLYFVIVKNARYILVQKNGSDVGTARQINI